MGLQFCVGDIPVPTYKHDRDEEQLLIKVVCGNRHKATMSWLTRGLGIDSLADLPDDNVLKMMRVAIEASRGKCTSMATKVDQEGNAQATTLTTIIGGHEITVANTLWPIQFVCSAAAVVWLGSSLHEDLKRAQCDSNKDLSHVGPTSFRQEFTHATIYEI